MQGRCTRYDTDDAQLMQGNQIKENCLGTVTRREGTLLTGQAFTYLGRCVDYQMSDYTELYGPV